MPRDKRLVIRIRVSSPDVQIVEASQVGRACDSHRPVVSVASGKRMPGKVYMAISRAPLTLDMAVVCTSGVATTSVQPPAVASVPVVVTATVTSGGIDASAGSSDVAPVPVLEPKLTPVGERVPAVERSRPPLSEPPDQLPVVEVVPAIDLPIAHCPDGRPLFHLRRWRGVMRETRRCPCHPIVFRRGALRMFRTRAVSFMCRLFRQNICFGHRGLIGNLRRLGSCCRRR